MLSKEITKEERKHWVNVLGETFIVVLSHLVKANLTDPVNLGRCYAALVMLNYSSDVLVDNKQENMIDWEENYLHECMIKEIVCYRYLLKWTLGNGTADEKDSIEKEWKVFELKYQTEVEKYRSDVFLGFAKYMRSLHEKYKDLEHPVFSAIDSVDKRTNKKEEN